jgi:Flp pilus assembly pilin Flp
MRTIRNIRTVLSQGASNLWRDQGGQEFMEYALMCGFLVVAGVSCLAAITATFGRFGAVMHLLMAAISRLSP